MDALDFASRLRACSSEVEMFAVDALAEFFGIGKRHFHQSEPDGPILFHPAEDQRAVALSLRSTIFWLGPNKKQIARGHPRIYSTSDHCSERFQALQEPLMAQAAVQTDAVVEPKLFGPTIRVFDHARELYCASDVAHDGGNPLVGAGIDNSRSLGIDYGSQAARLLGERYPKVGRLAALGYVAVFVLQLPELTPDRTVDRADMTLVDVIDPDMVFVDRLEKERIADDYGLHVVDLFSRFTLPDASPMTFLRRCRAMEHQSPPHGAGGFIVKTSPDESSDQLFVKVEPASERDRIREVTAGDLAAIVEEITGQMGDTVWGDEIFAEELMLEYLGTHHRSVRWKVNEYLSGWREARKLAGLG